MCCSNVTVLHCVILKSTHHPTNKKPLYNNKVPFVDIQSVFLLDFSYNKSSLGVTVYLLVSLSCYCLAFLISGLLGGLRRLNSSLCLSSSSFNDQGLLQNLHCPSPQAFHLMELSLLQCLHLYIFVSFMLVNLIGQYGLLIRYPIRVDP